MRVVITSEANGAQKTTTTTTGGVFRFDKVLPGRYQVDASHPKWQLSPARLQDVQVGSDSLHIDSGLEVRGYDVRGHVTSDGEPIPGVVFSLYSKLDDSSANCGLPNAIDDQQLKSLAADWHPICQTESDSSGRFLLPVVATGDYQLVPVYRGENIEFDIKPSLVEFRVQHDSHVIVTSFQVAGFRVFGRVLHRSPVDGDAGPVGLSGAHIYLNGRHVATSSDDGGHYHLENVKTGTYLLTAKAGLSIFSEF